MELLWNEVSNMSGFYSMQMQKLKVTVDLLYYNQNINLFD